MNILLIALEMPIQPMRVAQCAGHECCVNFLGAMTIITIAGVAMLLTLVAVVAVRK
jgi:hypothetical protein